MIVIGCDIGGMSIKSALVKENGEFIKKFRLRTGDLIEGKKREARENEKYGALIY